jgi:hypothetical protein
MATLQACEVGTTLVPFSIEAGSFVKIIIIKLKDCVQWHVPSSLKSLLVS